MLEDLEWRQIFVLNCLLQVIVCRRQLSLAIKEPERALGHEIHRRRGQADLMAVKMTKDVAVHVIDRPMRLICDDEVEESRIERLEDFLHGRVGGQKYPFARV